jgi:hypothetical protein
VATGAEGEAMQRLLRDYTETRIAVVRGSSDPAEVNRLNQRTNSLQNEIWQLATTVAERSPTPISGLLLSSLNEMIDLSLTNPAQLHQPCAGLRPAAPADRLDLCGGRRGLRVRPWSAAASS